MFDLTWLWTSFSGQLYIALAIIGAVSIVVGVITQNVWAGIGTFFGVVILAMCIAGLSNLESIGQFIWKNIWKGVPGMISTKFDLSKGLIYLERFRV